MKAYAIGLLALQASALLACSGGGDQPDAATDYLDTKALMDPTSCQKCHPTHFTEWSGSMHAYASDDPVFRAMNARGQRETHGALGSFCVNCHAPMAVRNNATKDGLNLDSVDASLKGVTCYFCHSVDAVNGSHDDPLTLATDSVMRGGITDPMANTAHRASYSALLDRYDPSSATLCGSCHDIDTSHGAHIERTFAEWQNTLFGHGVQELTCSQCHMDGTTGVAANVPGVPVREVHAHRLAAVDLALTPHPDADAQRADAQKMLDTTLGAVLCVKGANLPGGSRIQVVLDNIGAGHAWPSGASQDRRAWVELKAFSGDQVLYESGAVADDASIVDAKDPDVWLIRDCMFDANDAQVSMFWNAASVESNLLPGPLTSNTADPNFYLSHIVRTFPRSTSKPATVPGTPDKVSMRVRLMPVGLDVLDDLVASKDLDPSVRANMKPYSLGDTELTWTDATATIKYGDNGIPVSCVSSNAVVAANQATPAVEHMKCAP
jgi:hypothetical protein